jgi:Bacterial type II and III secretion system protein
MTQTLWTAGLLLANLWAAGEWDSPFFLPQDDGKSVENANPFRTSNTPQQAFPIAAEKMQSIDNDSRTPILPPIKAGEKPCCENPPSNEEILRALPTLAPGIPYVYEQYRDDMNFTVEKLVDRVDEPRFFPLIGPAQLHHCHWKCTVYFTEVIEITHPFPFTSKKRRAEVVYIDKDQLHLCTTQTQEEPTQPQSCPGGHFRPIPKTTTKPEAPRQVQMEITIVSIDRGAIPQNVHQRIRMELGLSIENNSGVAKDQDAARKMVQELVEGGFANLLATPHITTMSDQAGSVGMNDMTIEVCPVVKADGRIHLKASARLPSMQREPGGVNFGTKSVQSSAAIRDGQIFAIGGLTRKEVTLTKQGGIPLLDELPYIGEWIGRITQTVAVQESDRELLILVTPHILVPGSTETCEPPVSGAPKSVPIQPVSRPSNARIYLIVDSGDNGQQVTALPAAEQTVLDVVGSVKSVPADKIRKVRVSRVSADGKDGSVTLPVDWKAITQQGQTASNYQLEAGDRVHVYVEPAKEVRSSAMTLDDVVRMSKAGVADVIILRQMELTGVVFDLTTADIIHLREQGVSNRVIRAMQERRTSAATKTEPLELLTEPPALTKHSTTGYPEQAFEPGTDKGRSTRFGVRGEPSASSPLVELSIPRSRRIAVSVTNVTPYWHDGLRTSVDADAKTSTGLLGQVWLSNDWTGEMLDANGSLHVEAYDLTSKTPIKLSEWRFDRESLKKLKRTKDIGRGYALFLPWESHGPEITQIELRIVYMPENGDQPLHAEPQVIRLNSSAQLRMTPKVAPISVDFGFPIIRSPGDATQLFSFWTGLYR